ncbi:hypothetical protein GUJ93_ZPchr0012g19179 [Zizania palustris]|uniref:Uncharacterized protein n=1 Tax=Zizania palustris TaxID=103762 RepID=A0A8J5WR24_ZIZPA|nr:hypothetical protein GUJ93_ZPchr0012g19179 [Zizania palustris]
MIINRFSKQTLNHRKAKPTELDVDLATASGDGRRCPDGDGRIGGGGRWPEAVGGADWRRWVAAGDGGWGGRPLRGPVAACGGRWRRAAMAASGGSDQRRQVAAGVGGGGGRALGAGVGRRRGVGQRRAVARARGRRWHGTEAGGRGGVRRRADGGRRLWVRVRTGRLG